jgi:hypothetical protein
MDRMDCNRKNIAEFQPHLSACGRFVIAGTWFTGKLYHFPVLATHPAPLSQGEPGPAFTIAGTVYLCGRQVAL